MVSLSVVTVGVVASLTHASKEGGGRIYDDVGKSIDLA